MAEVKTHTLWRALDAQWVDDGPSRNGRWTKGAQRYDAKQQAEIDKRYHEAFGWRNGAKVRRR